MNIASPIALLSAQDAATPCPHCDGDGRLWNNMDPTSGMWVECVCVAADEAYDAEMDAQRDDAWDRFSAMLERGRTAWQEQQFDDWFDRFARKDAEDKARDAADEARIARERSFAGDDE